MGRQNLLIFLSFGASLIGKRDQGRTNLSPVDHTDCMIHGNFILVQKDSNTKKESFGYTEPSISKDCLPSLPLKTRKQKKEVKFFYRNNFVFPCIESEK